MKSSRKRNVARKAKANRIRTGSVSAPFHADPQSGFVPQNQYTPDSDIQNASPEAGSREPEAGIQFVSQNRANAQHSTGPRTAEGKAASSQNAFKHGLSIQRHAVLRDEDPALYAQLLAELRDIYDPRSPREALAVEDLAQCRWALARFDQAEAVCLQKLTNWCNDPVAFEGEEPIGAGESLGHAATVLTEVDEKGREYIEPDTQFPAFDKIHRYRAHWERKHARALAEFDRAQRARHAEANQLRAEAQAQRQAEAHDLKQELALAREVRQQELHALRMATAKAKQPSASTNPNPATGPATNPGTESASDEAADLAYLESLLNAPAPMTEQDFLRMRAAQAAIGFVSQPQTK
ncbi:MAG: hypothetical protein IT169_12840 [Bryobacterales bacterium]|nr:hypothetical protein [Bryobacterales bacterium]